MTTVIMNSQCVNTLKLNVDTPRLLELVESFKKFARKTAEGVLEMASTVFTASKLERESEYVRFCELIGLQHNGSTIKKLRMIGEKYEFLLANVEKLPSSWTTLYEISKLTAEEIESHIDKGFIHANMRGEDLKALLGKPQKAVQTLAVPQKVPNGTASTPDLGFRVRLPKSPDQNTVNRIRSLLEELKSLKAEVQVGTDLEAFLGV